MAVTGESATTLPPSDCRWRLSASVIRCAPPRGMSHPATWHIAASVRPTPAVRARLSGSIACAAMPANIALVRSSRNALFANPSAERRARNPNPARISGWRGMAGGPRSAASSRDHLQKPKGPVGFESHSLRLPSLNLLNFQRFRACSQSKRWLRERAWHVASRVISVEKTGPKNPARSTLGPLWARATSSPLPRLHPLAHRRPLRFLPQKDHFLQQ
jgi:hypothetical protein